MSSPVQTMPSPLRNFTRFLFQSHSSTGRINIPAKTRRETTKYLSSRPIIPIHHVEEIVAAIDHEEPTIDHEEPTIDHEEPTIDHEEPTIDHEEPTLDHEEPTICARLDLQGFLLVYQILSLTEECPAYHRGLSLLTQSLHEASGSPLAERDLRASKKTSLGKTALDFLVGCFVKAELTNRTRRWMGILALELLQNCNENKQLLLKASRDTWRCLGDLVFDGACYTLKMIAGMIIHEMWPNETPTKELWPPPRDPEIYKRFTNTTAQTSQWILDFEKFAIEQGSRSQSERETPDAVLAYAICIGELLYCVEGGSSILVTVSDELNIVIPASSTGRAKYVDIEIDRIQGVCSGEGPVESQSDSSQMESLVVLTIWFSDALEEPFYVNALGQRANIIKLAFTSSEAAATIEEILASRITNCPRASQFEPIDSRVETITDTQEPTTLVYCAMSPIDTQEFCEAVASPLAKGHFQDLPNVKFQNISRRLTKKEIPETPARESKHANPKDTDPQGISTSLSIAAKLQSALSSIIGAPQPPKKAPEKNLSECENGDVFEANNNSNCKQRLQRLEIPLDVYSEYNIIRFDRNGPRSQGIRSSQKPRRVLVPRCPSPELSTSLKVTGLKRKGQGDNDSGINPDSPVGPPAKRPRENADLTRTRDSASRRGLKRGSSTKQNARKAGPQSTRVDANGSPLPFIHSRKINLARPAIQPKPVRDVDSGCHDCAMHANNLRKSKGGFLSPQSPPSPPGAQCFQAYKAQPNTIYEYTANKLQSRGNSIDIQSHDVVEDARPLPFVDLYRDRLKNFMDRLESSSKNLCEQDNSALAATMNQDPEKTLVKAGHGQGQISSSVCSGARSSLSSSSPSSYSGDDSPSDDTSTSEGGDDDGDGLAAEFQPHQDKTLEVLDDISVSVVRNLASKEKALKDLASDYRLGGNRLIEEIEKSRQQDILAYQNVIDSVKRNLAGVYKRTQQKLEAGLAASLKREPTRKKIPENRQS